MAAGRKTKQLQGKFLGNLAPYGYRKDEDGYLAIDPVEAEVVQEIFHLYTEEGVTMNNIASQLVSQGYLTRNGGKWAPGRISQIMKKTTYKGQLYANRKKGGKPVDQSEWIRVDIPAIVKPAIWEAAQQRAKQNRLFSKRRDQGRLPAERATQLRGVWVKAHW